VPFAPSSPSPHASPLPGRTLLWALLLAGCTGGVGLLLPGDGQPAGIEVVRGDGQSGRVGEPLAAPLVVEVTDTRGRPVEGARVAFEFAGPGGDIVPDTATTDANGEADARIVLGTRIGTQTGQANLVTAEGSEAPKVSFTARALSENANGIAVVSGDEQSAPAGSTLLAPLVVEVTDAFGNPISGVPVSWTAEGGGSVSQSSTTTDDQGRASVERTLGPAAGAQTTLATSEGLAGSPVTFTHTATAGNAAGLSIVSGNNQTATAGSRLPADLVVRLVDRTGNGVPDAAVTWVVGLGGGDVTPENGTTDAAGRASAQLTLGPNPGENRVDAVVSGVDIVSFKAIGTRAGPVPTGTTITSDSPDPSVAGTTFTVEFQVSSEGGTPTGSVTVTVTDGTPSCTGSLQNGRGSCALQLNQTGDRTLRAVYSGAPGFGGSSDTEAHRVVPPAPQNRPPDADYNWHCEGLTCQFTDASRDPDGSIAGWNWNFAGTGSSSLKDPTHTFPATGEYQVTLTVTDNGGATDASTAGVEVDGGTTTTITSDTPDPSDPGLPITVSFRVNSSSGTPAGNVQVSDQNGGGCSGSAPEGSCSYTPIGFGSRTITATYQGNSSFNGSSATEPHTVTTPPPPPAGTSTTITSDEPDPSNPGAEVVVTFTVSSSAGTPSGTVEVTDPSGGSCTGSAPSGSCTYEPGGVGSRTITASYQGNSSFSSSSDTETHTVNAAPTALFTSSCVGLACTFDSSGSDDSDGDLVGWSWNFGDGSGGSTEEDPSHLYTAAGDYPVTLTVTDNDGATASTTQTVSVAALPPANEAPEAKIGSIICTGMSCAFTDDSTDPDGDETIAQWSWIFGDGGTSDLQNPVHEYATAGDYVVTLTVTDDQGLASETPDEESVTVSPSEGG
jgi:PKD repeat protein